MVQTLYHHLRHLGVHCPVEEDQVERTDITPSPYLPMTLLGVHQEFAGGVEGVIHGAVTEASLEGIDEV